MTDGLKPRFPFVPMKAPSSHARKLPFETECITFFAEVVQIFGVPRSVGQIYGLLYASPTPLSFSDIVEQLEISKGSASQGLQLLRSLGATRRVDHADNYREYFEPELGLRRLIGGILKGQAEPVVKNGGIRMKRLRELAEATTDAAYKDFQLDRVKQLETWRRQATLIMPVLKTLLASPRR